jgi:hypothetical protein
MIIAFLDDSGSHDGAGLQPGSRVVATAGFVMLGSRCPDFDHDWTAILAEFGVCEFHMRSFAHGRGEFERWPERRRNDLIKRLVAVIQEYALVAIGGLILVRDYQVILPEWVKTGIGHPVCMAFAVCLEEFVKFLNGMDVPIRAPGEKIKIVFDRMQPYHGRFIGIHQLIKRRDDHSDLLGDLIFHSRSELAQVQAADLIAYEFRKELDRICYDNRRPQRKSMEALCSRQNLVTGYMDADRLAKYAKSFETSG